MNLPPLENRETGKPPEPGKPEGPRHRLETRTGWSPHGYWVSGFSGFAGFLWFTGL